MKKSNFVKMIRTIVAEELQKQLPKIVSEMYLRRLISESGGGEGRSLKRAISFDEAFEHELAEREEQIPAVMPNSDEGIYQQGGAVRRKNESKNITSKLMSRENDMSSFYEGTAPIVSEQAQGPTTNIPLETISNLKGANDWYGMFKKMEGPSSNTPMKQTGTAEQRRLDEQRRSLDERPVDTSNRPTIK